MTGKGRFWPTPTERVEAELRIASEMVGHRPSCDWARFCARDLGFPPHSAIHAAAEKIIAGYMAQAVIFYAPELARAATSRGEG